MLPWAGGLALLSLPTTDPAGDIEFLKPKGGDVFRRVRKDGSEAEEIQVCAGCLWQSQQLHALQQPGRLGLSSLPKTKISVKQ